MIIIWEKINSKGFVRVSFAAFSMGKCEWFEIIITLFLLLLLKFNFMVTERHIKRILL